MQVLNYVIYEWYLALWLLFLPSFLQFLSKLSRFWTCPGWAAILLFLAGFFLLTNLVDSIEVVESSNDLDGKFWDSDESFLKDGEVFLFGVFSLGDLTIFGLLEESRSKLTSKEFGWDEDEAHSSMLRLSSSTIIFESSKLFVVEVSSRILESNQGNLLKSIDKKHVIRDGIEPIKRVFTYFKVTHFL